MPIPLIISTLWLLCIFAAVVHASQLKFEPINIGTLLLTATLALWLTKWIPPQAGWIGILISVSAIWQLLRSPSSRALSVLSGVYGALAASIYVMQGMPLWLAALVSVGLPCVSTYLAHRGSFVSPLLRQQALMGLAWAAPCVAATPSVISGWQSAQALNMTMEAATGSGVPTWTWQFVVLALTLGFLHGLWVRR